MKLPVLYYYVPPCPCCGSKRTGRYVKQPYTQEDTKFLVSESLRHGELVRLCSDVPIENAYCEDCGYEWPEHIHAQIWDTERVREQIRERGTAALYAELLENNMKEKKKGIFGKLIGVFR